jgi:LysM repeat protein
MARNVAPAPVATRKTRAPEPAPARKAAPVARRAAAPEPAPARKGKAAPAPVTTRRAAAPAPVVKKAAPKAAPAGQYEPRAGSKLAKVVDMLDSKKGVTIEQIGVACDWNDGMVRTIIARLNRDFNIENIGERGNAIYRLA